MRAGRLLSIVLLLQNRGRLTGPELARELEVSVRTIYRDIDALSASGIPVIGDRGPAGGFRLLDGYRTRMTGLTEGEADTLFLAATPGLAEDLGLGPEHAAARLKLLAALSPTLRERVGRATDRFLLDVSGWFGEEDDVPFLPVVAGAVWNGRRVRMRYQRWRGLVDRTIDPLAIVLKGGTWYLVGAADGSPRTYRVARIEQASATDEPATRPDGFDLEAFWAEWSEQFYARLYPDEATIRLSPSGMALAPHFLDRFRTRRIRATATEPDSDGWVTARIPIESVGHAALELLHFGLHLRVVAPDSLRAEVAALAGAVAAGYDPDPG